MLVNKAVADSDFLVGIGGIYPNHTAGFGGGSKLALGVLGFRSIATLHYRHRSVGWGTPNSLGSFRRDLDEIAQLIGLNTNSVATAERRPRSRPGPLREPPCLLRGSARLGGKEAYRAPAPDDRTDVVISNAYPADLSLTFARMKAFHLLNAAPLHASKIAIASCSRGWLSRAIPIFECV